MFAIGDPLKNRSDRSQHHTMVKMTTPLKKIVYFLFYRRHLQHPDMFRAGQVLYMIVFQDGFGFPSQGSGYIL